MEVRTIRLCYRKVINVASVRVWDKLVFDATYKEYYMQAQQFDQHSRFITFSELSEKVKGANQIHYLVSTSIAGYIQQLGELIPDVTNAHGQTCVTFKNFKFEVLQSSVKSKDQHSIAIQFYSEPLTWVDTVNNQLVVAKGQVDVGAEVETDMITMIPGLLIFSVKYTAL